MNVNEKIDQMHKSHIGLNWEGNPKKKWYVVCAACRHRPTGLIVTGARHFDKVMRAQIFSLQGYDKCAAALGQFKEMLSSDDWRNLDQGFIDNYGDFLTREEAWYVAKYSNQIKFPTSTAERFLFSENLY